MRARDIKSVLIMLACLSLALGAGPTSAPSDEIVYKPPKRGAPGARVGGGSRGADEKLPTLAVLVPETLAFTTREQPVLFWFIAKPTTVRCEIAITDMGTLDTVYETTLTGVPTAGLQKLDLAKANVKLKPGVQYQWLVALVPDANAPSKNVDAGGMLTRVAPPDGIAEKLNGASVAQKASVYAAEGIWFDALAELNDAIAANPQDAALREKLVKLLQQVGLKDAAEYCAK